MKNIQVLQNKKIAIVVEELTQLGGAERELDCILEIFPDSPIYTLVWDAEKTLHRYDNQDIRTSVIQKLPLGKKKYKWYLALMPWAVEKFDLSDFDIIISITSALVKGIKTTNKQLHICYCNTPTRYLWVDSQEYLKNAPIPFYIRPLMPLVIKYLKKWDLKASRRPDFIIANSKNVAQRINRYYHRKADTIIYPTADTVKFKPASKKDFYLLVSRIEPYKKIDLVIEAFRGLNEKLIIVGSGSKLAAMRLTAPKNIKFVGRLSDEKLSELYAQAKAFIFPQEEDFGLTPIESMAAGTPVIAYKKGGVLETVVAGVTGEFFYPQEAEALEKVIVNFNPRKYQRQRLQKQAQKFDNSVFKREFLEYTIDKISQKLKQEDRN